jgi:hypothetical protein
VYKPATGARTKHFEALWDKVLQASFYRQICCTQNHAFLNEHEKPAVGEVYSLEKPTA